MLNHRLKITSKGSTGLIVLGLLTACLGFSGCGGSGTTAEETKELSASVQNTGQLQVAITDAEGDFLSYTVDVESITLKKANGAEVETIPLTTRIDFAEYTEMTEFFNVVTLPTGVYVSAALNLNYQDAEIVIQDDNGMAYSATAFDSSGETITSMQVSVQLDDDLPIVIKHGVPASLTLDFDLEASNTIESFDPAIVTVEPFILADAEFNRDRGHRARGLLKSVDVESSQFSAKLRPFYRRHGEFGEVTVTTHGTTHYEINGELATGEAGLLLMARLDVDTPILTFGHMAVVSDEVDDNLRTNIGFVADRVHAGTSVPWFGHDAIRGVVIARDENIVTVRGRHWDRADRSVSFNDNVLVTLTESTRVTRQGLDNEGVDIDSISVGQRLVAFGELNREQRGDVSGERLREISLNTRNGHVRMMMNVIKGVVVSVEPLAVDLLWINGRRPDLFDFSGTGAEETSDAERDYYEIDSGSLTLENIDFRDVVKTRGFITPFGSAPEDYEAHTMIETNIEQ
ncbi:MAG: DUF4382 domain-containing protein [Pseudomonadales bacterium]|nr:DUF4382 domain-containing protein [Pseudomonadales bacterium]